MEDARMFPYTVLASIDSLREWMDDSSTTEKRPTKEELPSFTDPTGAHNLLVSAVLCSAGSEYIRDLLNEFRFPVDCPSRKEGYSALYYAVTQADLDSTICLINGGADLSLFAIESVKKSDSITQVMHGIPAAFHCSERTLWHVICEYCTLPFVSEFIRTLLSSDPSPTSSSPSSSSSSAIIPTRLSLSEIKTQVLCANANGMCAVDSAFMHERFDIVEFLERLLFFDCDLRAESEDIIHWIDSYNKSSKSSLMSKIDEEAKMDDERVIELTTSTSYRTHLLGWPDSCSEGIKTYLSAIAQGTRPFSAKGSDGGDEFEALLLPVLKDSANVVRKYNEALIRQRIDEMKSEMDAEMAERKMFKSERFNHILEDPTSYSSDSLMKIKMVRELNIVDQFEDELFKSLISKYGTNSAICGFLCLAVSELIVSMDLLNFYDDRPVSYEVIQSRLDGMIEEYLSKSDKLAPLVEKAMKHIQSDRRAYITGEYAIEFENEGQKEWYLKDWVANYEISDYLNRQSFSNVVFVRHNQFPELKDGKHEERRRIISEESSFGLTEQIVFEFFPYRRQLLSADSDGDGADSKMVPDLVAATDSEKLKMRVDEMKKEMSEKWYEKCVFILDHNGHFNTGIVINQDLIILDSLRKTNHCTSSVIPFWKDLVIM